MPVYPYSCVECGHQFFEIVSPKKSKTTVTRAGDVNTQGDESYAREATCPRCGFLASRVIGRTQAYLRADATQASGWKSPGMSSVNYANAPHGGKAAHLKDVYGQFGSGSD